MERKFNEGDLVYIPQDVKLFDMDNHSYNLTKTDRPITAVFLRQDVGNTVRVFAQGREASVERRHIYPMEEANAG